MEREGGWTILEEGEVDGKGEGFELAVRLSHELAINKYLRYTNVYISVNISKRGKAKSKSFGGREEPANRWCRRRRGRAVPWRSADEPLWGP